jgi:hypothetical protein
MKNCSRYFFHLHTGFVSISDVSSPPVVSRHLVLPHFVAKDDISTNGGTDEDCRQATLCVFLHGALKVENMCALVQVCIIRFHD